MVRVLGMFAAAASLSTAGSAAERAITYDCDSAPGHFSELVLPAPTVAFTVTGNVTVNAIAADKKWAPGARLLISPPSTSPGDNPEARAGVSLTALPGKSVGAKQQVVQYLSFTANGHEDEIITFSFKAPGAPQPFSLSYDGKSVVVAVDGETRAYPLVTSEPVVRIVCSTGEFLFTDLRIKAR